MGLRTFTFAGTSSSAYSMFINEAATYNVPERAVEMLEIPGRSGHYALDQGRFENVEVTYHVVVHKDTNSNFQGELSDVRNWLASKVGYQRLTDDYNTGVYRMAIFKGGLDIGDAYINGAEFDIVFECKPQRWLTSGETAVTIGQWGETETASGEIATFEADSATAIKTLTADIDPIQDLHGYDAPWVGGAGKNKCVFDASSTTKNGLTFTVNADKSVTVTGTASAGTSFHTYVGANNSFGIANGTYKVSGCPSGGSSSTYRFYVDNRSSDGTSTINSVGESGSGDTITITQGKARAYIYISNGYAIPTGGITFYPMMRLSTEADGTFAPYENICPISGRSSVDVVRTGKNLLPLPYTNTGGTTNGITYSVSSDGKITISNTATATAWVKLYGGFVSDSASIKKPVPSWIEADKTYTLSGGQSANVRLQINFYQGSTSLAEYKDEGSGVSFTPTSTLISNADTMAVFLRIANGTTASGTISPMIRLSSTSATWTPFGTTYTTALGTTVYGGTLDLVSGGLSDEWTSQTINGANAVTDIAERTNSIRFWYYMGTSVPQTSDVNQYAIIADGLKTATTDPNANDVIGMRTAIAYPYSICCSYPKGLFSADATSIKNYLQSNPLQIVYKKRTPQTYQLTPQQVQTLLGTNNVWSTGGDVTVEYGQNPMVLINPTPFEAEPLLAVKGYGKIQFNGYEVDIQDAYWGDVDFFSPRTVPLKNQTPHGEGNLFWANTVGSAKRNRANTGDVITCDGDIVFYVDIDDGGYDIESESSDVTLEYIRTNASLQTLQAKFTATPTNTCVLGTNGNFFQYTRRLFVKQSGTTIQTVTMTFTGRYSYISESFWLEVSIDHYDNISFYDTGLSTSRCDITGSYVVDSTKSYLGNEIYLDCDLGMCYMNYGGIIDLNQFIDLGTDLPKLPTGTTTITYDNTITRLKVTPRWWKV